MNWSEKFKRIAMEHTAVAGQTDLDEPEPSYRRKLLSSVNKLSSQTEEYKMSTGYGAAFLLPHRDVLDEILELRTLGCFRL